MSDYSDCCGCGCGCIPCCPTSCSSYSPDCQPCCIQPPIIPTGIPVGPYRLIEQAVIMSSPIERLSGLRTLSDSAPGTVNFRMRRRNKTVTFQWEHFEGSMTLNGCRELLVTQTFPNLPPHLVYLPLIAIVNGKEVVGYLRVYPAISSYRERIIFALPEGLVNLNDHIVIPGGCVCWIIDE